MTLDSSTQSSPSPSEKTTRPVEYDFLGENRCLVSIFSAWLSIWACDCCFRNGLGVLYKIRDGSYFERGCRRQSASLLKKALDSSKSFASSSVSFQVYFNRRNQQKHRWEDKQRREKTTDTYIWLGRSDISRIVEQSVEIMIKCG